MNLNWYFVSHLLKFLLENFGSEMKKDQNRTNYFQIDFYNICLVSDNIISVQRCHFYG